MQVLASRQGGESPGNVYPSFANTGLNKRTATHISFKCVENRPDDAVLMGEIQQALEDQGLGGVLLGWEHNFLLPEDSYIIVCSCMSWLTSEEIKAMLSEIVAVSAGKFIVKLKPLVSIERIKQTFVAYNSVHTAVIRKLLAYDGKVIWSEHVQPPTQGGTRHISKSIEVNLRNASAKAYKELISVLLSSAQDNMTKNGFNFDTSGIVADWTKMKRKRSGPVTVTFPTVPLARAFFYSYQDFEWESDDCTQTIIIQLTHEIFDAELQKPEVRIAIGSCKVITPEVVSSTVAGISN